MRRDAAQQDLLERLWSTDRRYYELAREQVRGAAAAGGEYAFLDRHLPARGRILEVGCGEASNLAVLARPDRSMHGCDLSPLGPRMAREDGLEMASRLVVAAAEALPFATGSFEGVFAVSVLEHLPEPEAVLEQMIRVLAPGGRLVLVSPQYGGPLGASPCRRGGGASRFARRLLRAHLPAGDGARLGWDRVRPAVLDGAVYDGDLDAVVEPELRSLSRFLSARGLTIVEASSGFAWHTWRGRNGPLAQKAIRLVGETLARAGIPPYTSFGPLVAVAAERP